MSTIDFSPLTDASADPPARVLRNRAGMRLGAVYAFVALTLIPMGVGVTALTFAPSVAEDNGSFTAGFPSGLLLLVVGLLSLTLMAGTIVGTIIRYRVSRVWMPLLAPRLPAFAAANGLLYSPRDENPDYPGTMFVVGEERTAIDHLRSTEGRYFDLGSYRLITGAGRHAVLQKFGFIAIRLDRKLPHMLLEATAHQRWADGGLPMAIDRDQVLSLEGDFDRYFTLFAPTDYETDALYVFAPDLMALLIDETGGMHVEIVDDWLFVYSTVDFEGASVEDYQRYFRIIDVVGAKALRQTGSYEDDRLGQSVTPGAPQVVAPGGQRLRRGRLTPFGKAMLPVYGAIIVIMVIIVVLANLWD